MLVTLTVQKILDFIVQNNLITKVYYIYVRNGGQKHSFKF